jgi:hypothetical protein
LSEKYEVTDELVVELKKLYPTLFKKTVAGQIYIFRPMYRQEYIEILNFIEDNKGTQLKLNDLDEKCFDRCVLFPKLERPEMAILPAGVVPTLAKSIQEKSGFEISEVFGAVVAPSLIESVSDYAKPKEPTSADISEAKAKTPYDVVKVSAGPFTFLCRGLNRLEWNTLMKQGDTGEDTDSLICNRATLWPQGTKWEELPSGIVSSVSNAIMGRSGFDLNTTVEEL